MTLIGEKNLEFEVEENYQEMERLLTLLGLKVGIRYVRNQKTSVLTGLGDGSLNILREPDLTSIGRDLEKRFQIPFLPSFPVGLKGTLEFLEDVGDICRVESSRSIENANALQEEMLEDFSDLEGEVVSIVRPSPLVEMEPACISLVEEIVPRLGMRLDLQGVALPLPVTAPVGTAGVRRLLHRWRRIIHA